MDEARQLRLVDEGDSGVLHGDAAAPVRVEGPVQERVRVGPYDSGRDLQAAGAAID
ncbi:hypothetical protein ACODT3_33555 [Streptomyces sp. 4.24]|uniref:hypothetical protein n=1 Tax=Streptomyces tritrimontium TaxID=3406573 RepID=UPI003BB4D9B4